MFLLSFSSLFVPKDSRHLYHDNYKPIFPASQFRNFQVFLSVLTFTTNPKRGKVVFDGYLLVHSHLLWQTFIFCLLNYNRRLLNSLRATQGSTPQHVFHSATSYLSKILVWSYHPTSPPKIFPSAVLPAPLPNVHTAYQGLMKPGSNLLFHISLPVILVISNFPNSLYLLFFCSLHFLNLEFSSLLHCLSIAPWTNLSYKLLCFCFQKAFLKPYSLLSSQFPKSELTLPSSGWTKDVA